MFSLRTVVSAQEVHEKSGPGESIIDSADFLRKDIGIQVRCDDCDIL